MSLLEKIFWFSVGAFLMRYVILNTPDYREKEAQELDDLRNKVHDALKKYAPEADDAAISEDVLSILPEK
jgi:hypothetical protein